MGDVKACLCEKITDRILRMKVSAIGVPVTRSVGGHATFRMIAALLTFYTVSRANDYKHMAGGF